MSVSPSKVIKSPKNVVIKTRAKLKDRRSRDKEHRYLIEGSKELQRALDASYPVEQIYFCRKLLRYEGEHLLQNIEAKVELIEVSMEAFEKLSMRQNPDGLIGLALMQTASLKKLQLVEHPLILVIDGLEKPGNIGALLRTADAVNVDAVFVTGRGTDLYNPNVIRSSVGSVFTRPVLAVDSEELISFLAENMIQIVATSPNADKTYWQENFRPATAIVLGAEHAGLDKRWFQAADARVSIPMHGTADSLNVATAGALLLYEAVRQRSY